MTHYTSDQLAVFPWIVSSDTLRAEDLLPRFWTTAEQLAQVLQERIPANLLEPLTLLVGEDSRETDWNDDLAADTLAELFDLLQSWAPAGFSFGASEGDGACFGFWLTPEWCDALEVLGFGNDDPTGWAELVARLEADGLDPDNMEDAYQGRAEGWSEERAGADFAEQTAYDSGMVSDQQHWPLNCIDWDAAWRELQTGDGYRLHDIGGGEWLVFRSV
jgi:hypothetical protein